MNIKKWLNGICLGIIMIVGIFMIEIPAQAGTVYNSPYVTFSPDGKAFTFNHQDKNWEWYDVGKKVTTGVTSSLRTPVNGEHEYKYQRKGKIPIKEWEVVHKTGTCCHNSYPNEGLYYHGIEFRREWCSGSYYSGWNAYCADCQDSKPITNMLIYMSEEAARSITELDIDLEHYYTCPYCANLEQGSPFDYHDCKAISWNKYKVEYNKNNGFGYMESSFHMYNNATEYEGQPITPSTRLTKNTYTRTGYEFVGWKIQKGDGGDLYIDNQEIPNLTTENYDGLGKGVVTLYAQWKLSKSTLHINPNGGKYQGKSTNTSENRDYKTTYDADSKYVIPPDGYRVSFVTGYSKHTPDITQTRTFQEWQISSNFHGKLDKYTYTYLGIEGMEDTITATYSYDSIILPTPEGIGGSSSFGGWYYDKECTSPAGKAGDKITPSSDLTLYAKSVELLLKSVNNMTPYGGSGAVNLSWNQNDGNEKTYLLYQSTDNKAWNRIYGASDMAETKNVNLSYDWIKNGKNQDTYITPYTGFYTLTAFGAQGGNYGTNRGGYGGQAEGKLWLTKGEKVTYTLGGQNGYNGGGTGNMFSNGGGCTVITTDKKGTILVAGGGGGATSLGSGGSGGSTAKNISTGTKGENGGAGGGGGYKGGAAGLVDFHYCTPACSHVHVGNTSTLGGCYTKENISTINDTCYVDRRTINSSTGTCGCGGKWEGRHYGMYHSSCGGEISYYKEGWCNSCDATSGSMPSDYPHFYTKTITTYSLNCGRNEGKICGYTNGQVTSSAPAYGGSNYVNDAYFTSQTSHIGTKANNGSFAITSDQIGFEEALYLNEVKATDLAPPKQVVLPKDAKTDIGNNQVKVVWNESRDNGTVYYHKAESHEKKTSTKLSTSNITRNELLSGTKGYYYLVDKSASTTVSTANGTFTSNAFATVTVTNYAQYLHISAVDLAGNISPTTHVEIGKYDNEIAWEIWTDKMQIASEKESVYSAHDVDTYYVRADGTTPFQLSFAGFANVALPTYQVNHTIFQSSVDDIIQEFGLYTKNYPITNDNIVTNASDLDKYVAGTSILQDAAYTVTTRSEGNKKLAVLQKFLLPFDFHGKKIQVTPVAGADYKDSVQYSDVDKDKLNSLWIIGDGIAPIFNNTHMLEALELIDRNAGDVLLEIGAEDDLSGVKEFYIEIYNTDNVSRKRYDANASNVVIINITEDEPIFSGDFIITLFAKDNVGNTREEVYSTTEFALTSSVSRILSPHDPVFKCGESGILNIVTYGYADYIEIEFPPAMSALNPELNKTIYYTDIPQYYQEENIQFMVPLATPYNTSFTITVRAYKGDKKLEDYPALSVIEVNETVTDEIRTRLR